jgi:ribosomal protein S12 methylthiotransferase accessory factor
MKTVNPKFLLKPLWNLSYNVLVLNSEKVRLFNENDDKILNGRVFPLLAPLLNGQHTISDIYKKLANCQVSKAEIIYALEQCQALDLVLQGGGVSPNLLAFWHSLNLDWTIVENRLKNTQISLTALGTVDIEQMKEALLLLNIKTVDEGDFHVVLTDDYLSLELEKINNKALLSKTPWMLVKPVGNSIWIGPVFYPQETGCWKCLQQRLQMNRWLETRLESVEEDYELIQTALTSFSTMPSMVHMSFGLAATEIAKAVVLGNKNILNGTLITFNAINLEMKRHVLTQRPQCPACGTPHFREILPKPLVLKSCKKQVNSESGSRTVSPETTYARLEHHISPVTGIVPSLEPLSGKDESGLIYTYLAGPNLAMVHGEMSRQTNMRSRSGGKGTTDIQAKVSALCESIERYSAVYHGDEISISTSYSEIESDALHPNDIMLFSDQQYQERCRLNANHTSGFHWVPKILDKDCKIEWTQVWSLTNDNYKWVPSAYCYFGHPDLEKEFMGSDSNGNAAGNTLEEAILQGFLELVERDAAAIFWYNKIQRPGLDLASIDDPYIQALSLYYKSIGRNFWIIDITSDLGIPTFASLSQRIEGPTEDILIAFGAHLTPRIALLRSLLEMNQFLPSVATQDAEGNTQYFFPEQEAINWWKNAKLQENCYLTPHPNLPTKKLSDFINYSTNDLRTDVEKCVEIAHNHALEVFVLDQTRPDIGLNVAKVIIPGLRHFWMRFGAGRLYDVPVKLGWLEEPLKESDLNPIGIFF